MLWSVDIWRCAVSGCPPGCECDADFTCSRDGVGALKCRPGYVSTGSDCVGEKFALFRDSLVLSVFSICAAQQQLSLRQRVTASSGEYTYLYSPHNAMHLAVQSMWKRR